MQSVALAMLPSIYSFVMDLTAQFYSRPSHDFRGGAFHVFAGSRRQRGGSIFGSLKRFFTPIAKMLGTSLLSHGANLARNVAEDAIAGRNVKNALLNRGKAAAMDFGKDAISKGIIGKLTGMIGKGRRRRKATRRLRRKVSRKRKTARRSVKRKSSRKSASRKPKSRKRRARSHSTHQRKAKRRRVANF